MKDRKRVLFTFAVYDHTGIKEYLEKQAKEGWMLEKVNDLFMEFRKTAPKDIQFAVSYFSKASIYDPKPSQDQMRFQDFCEHTGWTHIASRGEMQIFCSENENAIPIETDAHIEVQNVHKTMKKIFLPYCIYLIVILSFQVGNFIIGFDMDSMKILADNFKLLFGFCNCLALVLTIIEFVCYLRWRKKAIKLADEGVFMETSGKTNFQMLVVAIMCVGLIFMIASFGGNTLIPFALGSVASIVLGVVIICYCIGFMKRRNISKKINRIVTAIQIVLLFVIISAITFPMLWKMGISSKSEPAYTYEYEDTTFKVYKDEIPFRIEDFMDTDYSDYSTECTEYSSVLVDYIEASQRTRFDAEKMHSMEYTLTRIKVPLMHELAKNLQLKSVEEHYGVLDECDEWYELVEIDADPWEAEEAYQIYIDEEATGHYALFFEDIMVEIQFYDEWELSDEQKSVIGEKFKKLK